MKFTEIQVGGDLSLGESFETLDREDNWYLFDAVVKAVKLVSFVLHREREMVAYCVVFSWKVFLG